MALKKDNHPPDDKSTPPKTEKVTPTEVARRIAETAGMKSEEIVRLLHSLSCVDRSRTIIQRTTGQRQGLFASISEKRKKVLDALEHAANRLAERTKRENERLKHHQKDTPHLDPLDEDEYPQRVSPVDIAKSIDGARKHLGMLDVETKRDPVSERRAHLILRIVQNLKESEVTRVAYQVSQKQRRLYELQLKLAGGVYKPPSAMPASPLDSDKEREMERARRQLAGFGQDLHTLLDDASAVVEDNYDAAANVLKQWVGHQEHRE